MHMKMGHVHGRLNHQQVHDAVANRGDADGNSQRLVMQHQAQGLATIGFLARRRPSWPHFLDAQIQDEGDHSQQSEGGVAGGELGPETAGFQTPYQQGACYGGNYPSGYHQGDSTRFERAAKSVGSGKAVEVGKGNVNAQQGMRCHQPGKLFQFDCPVTDHTRGGQGQAGQQKGFFPAYGGHQPGGRQCEQHHKQELKTVGHGG